MNKLASPSSIPLSFQEHGAGAPMVLVHGWGVSGAAFEAQIQALSAHYRLVIPDLPSHGASPPFPENGAFSLLADSLAALIHRLGLEQPLLVGWSLGAMVCWDLLLRKSKPAGGGPETSFRGLVSVDIMPRVLAGEDWRYGLGAAWMSEFDISLEAMRADWPAFCASFVPGIFAKRNEQRLADTIARTRKVAEGNDATGAIRLWQQMLAQDFRARLGRLELPAMFIAGGQSRLWEEGASQWMAGHLPAWRHLLFEGSGHSPQLEEPERFNQTILDFAAEVCGEPKTTHPQPAQTGAEIE